MAEGVTAESVKVILGHLECSICCTRYNQPKNLDCSHSYCLKCLQELKKTHNPDTNKLKCPLCQKETILPLDGVTGLQSNYLLIALVEEVNKQEQLQQGEESKVMCQACDEENAAISRCLNCEHYLCLECQKAHQRFSAMKNHEIKTLAELQEVDETQTESKMNISRCDIHPIQELCLYCMTCEQLICKVCSPYHQAPLHTVLDLKSATDKCLQEITDGVYQLDRSNSRITNELAFLLNRLSIMINETMRQISEKAEKEFSKIRNMEKNLLQEASKAGSKKGKSLAKFCFAQEGLKILQSSNTDSKSLEVLKNRQKHLQKYINIDEGKAVDLTYDLSFLSFKESKNEIGSLLLKEKWEERVKTRVGGECIGTFSTGDLLVVGKGKETILTIITPEGTVSHTYGRSWFRGNLHNPISLAVNNEDHMIILDGTTVNTFGSNFQLLHQFTPGKESGSEPTCLAVDENNLIAVGYKDKGEVSLHNTDGSLIRTLSAPGIDKYMIMNSQKIIYTSSKENVIMCASVNETKCKAFFKFGKATPYGICCDKVGDVYIVNEEPPKPDLGQSSKKSDLQRSLWQGKVGEIDDESDVIEVKKRCIGRHRFGYSILARSYDTIRDITYTPNGHLAVVGENCTKLYQRV